MNKETIISHCRQMDKSDVYEWIAEDELKIKDLKQRIDKAKELSDEIYNFIKCINRNLFYEIEDLLIKQDEILGGKE